MNECPVVAVTGHVLDGERVDPAREIPGGQNGVADGRRRWTGFGDDDLVGGEGAARHPRRLDPTIEAAGVMAAAIPGIAMPGGHQPAGRPQHRRERGSAPAQQRAARVDCLLEQAHRARIRIEGRGDAIPGARRHRLARGGDDAGAAVSGRQARGAVVADDKAGAGVVTLGPGADDALAPLPRRGRHDQCLEREGARGNQARRARDDRMEPGMDEARPAFVEAAHRCLDGNAPEGGARGIVVRRVETDDAGAVGGGTVATHVEADGLPESHRHLSAYPLSGRSPGSMSPPRET